MIPKARRFRATTKSGSSPQVLERTAQRLKSKPPQGSTFVGGPQVPGKKVAQPHLSALVASLPEAVTLEPPFGKSSEPSPKIELRKEVQRLHDSGELIVGGLTGSYDPLGRLVAFDPVDGLRLSAEAMSRVGSPGGGRELELALLRALLIRERVQAQKPADAHALWRASLNAEAEADQLLEARTGGERREPASSLTGTAYYPAAGFDEEGLSFVSAAYPGVTSVLHVDPMYSSKAVHQGSQRAQSIWVPGDAVSFSVQGQVGEQAAVVLFKTAGDFGSLMGVPGFIGNSLAQLKVGGELVNSSGWHGSPLLAHLPLELIGLQRTAVRGHGLGYGASEVLQKVSEVTTERVTRVVELDHALTELVEGDGRKLPATELVGRLEALLERGGELGVRAQLEGAVWRALTLDERQAALPVELAQFKAQRSKPVLSADLTHRPPQVLSDILPQSKVDLPTWMSELSRTLLEDSGTLKDRFSRWQEKRGTLSPQEEAVHGRKLDELERDLTQRLTASALAQLDRPFVDGEGRPAVPVFDVMLQPLDSGPARDLLFAVAHNWVSRAAVEKILQARIVDLKRAVAADPSLSKLFRSFERNQHYSPGYADSRWGVASLYALLQIVRGFDVLKPADVDAILGKLEESDLRDLRKKELDALISDYRYDQNVHAGKYGDIPKLSDTVYLERQQDRARKLRMARDAGEFDLLNSLNQELGAAILSELKVSR